MAFTPGARAYGDVDDYFAGAINRMGWQIEPGGTVMATWGSKESMLCDALKAPALVLNVYAPHHAQPDDYSQYLFDVIWGETKEDLQEFGVNLTSNLIAALGDDPKAFFLVINQVDTLSADRFAGHSRWSFDGTANPSDRAAYNCKGVIRLRAGKGCYVVETVLLGKPTWDEVTALMSTDTLDRLSPEAKHVPFRNPFAGIRLIRATRPQPAALHRDTRSARRAARSYLPPAAHAPLRSLQSSLLHRATGAPVLCMADGGIPLPPERAAIHPLPDRRRPGRALRVQV